MEELVDESYLIEYTLREMDEVFGGMELGTITNGHKHANGREDRVHELDGSEDVTMV